MKRGRPNIRNTIQEKIIEILSKTKTPTTTTSLSKQISKEFGKTVSWNTVEKYLHELIQLEKVQAVQLPHSKKQGKTGLTVYMLKR